MAINDTHNVDNIKFWRNRNMFASSDTYNVLLKDTTQWLTQKNTRHRNHIISLRITLTLNFVDGAMCFFVWRSFTPSKRRISIMFPGNSSTFSVTRRRHSGQRNSCLEATIAFKHPLQNVCWQGKTLHVSSKRSRHTEQSTPSKIDEASIESIGIKWDGR